ncbi:hypothetical protein FGO68_gene8187 [Halteria grandinella]|uniref:Uncharacterized protein n=1 Tax=Halteria grandinella TaxID=5974 RepID=A0A8J8TAU5_HALGN|nr:hypothetical protein FGO68_gene8187 [Halteria grandinella]
MTSIKYEGNNTDFVIIENGETFRLIEDTSLFSLKTDAQDGVIIESGQVELLQIQNPPQMKDIPIRPLRIKSFGSIDNKMFRSTVLRLTNTIQNQSESKIQAINEGIFPKYIAEQDNKQCEAPIIYICYFSSGIASHQFDCRNNEIEIEISNYSAYFLQDSALTITLNIFMKTTLQASLTYKYNSDSDCFAIIDPDSITREYNENSQELQRIAKPIQKDEFLSLQLQSCSHISESLHELKPTSQEAYPGGSTDYYSADFNDNLFIQKQTSKEKTLIHERTRRNLKYNIKHTGPTTASSAVSCIGAQSTSVIKYEGTVIPATWYYDKWLPQQIDTFDAEWSNSQTGCVYNDFQIDSDLPIIDGQVISEGKLQIKLDCTAGNCYQYDSTPYTVTVIGTPSWTEGGQELKQSFNVVFMYCIYYLSSQIDFSYYVNGTVQEKSIFNSGYPTGCEGVIFTMINLTSPTGITQPPPSISFNQTSKNIEVKTSDLNHATPQQKGHTMIINATYQNGLKKVFEITINITINHPCKEFLETNSYNSTYYRSATFVYDVFDSTGDQFELTSANRPQCPEGQYSLVDTSQQGVQFETPNIVKIDIPKLLTLRNTSFNIQYLWTINNDSLVTTYDLQPQTATLNVELIKCKEFYGFSEASVTYVIRDESVSVQNYYYKDEDSRAEGCRFIYFYYTTKDSQGIDPSNYLPLALSQEKSIQIQTADSLFANLPNQPFTITLIGYYNYPQMNLPQISFKLYFQEECALMTLSLADGATIPETVDYYIKEGPMDIDVPLHQASSLHLNCSSVIYAVKAYNSTMEQLDQSPIFVMDLQTQKLTIHSIDYIDYNQGPYQIRVSSELINYPQINNSYQFTVNFICPQESLMPTNDNLDELFSLPEQTYKISTEALKILIKPFNFTPECSKTETKARIEVYQTDFLLQVTPSFISLDSNHEGRYVLIYSEKAKDMKQYPSFVVKYIEEVESHNGTVVQAFFKIPVTLIVDNSGPPYFSKEIPQILVDIGLPTIINFPPFKDPDPEDQVTLVAGYPIFDPEIAQFVTGQYPKYYLKVTDLKLAGKLFQATVQLTDNNPYMPLLTEKSFKIKINENTPANSSNQTNSSELQSNSTPTFLKPKPTPPKSSQSKPVSTPKYNIPLTAKISSISQFGVIKISFNQKIYLSETNITLLNQIGILQDLTVYYEKDQLYRDIMGYQVLSIGANEIDVQVIFTQPLSISSGYVRYKCQSLSIGLRQNEFFVIELN